jgi:hypothetical protein
MTYAAAPDRDRYCGGHGNSIRGRRAVCRTVQSTLIQMQAAQAGRAASPDAAGRDHRAAAQDDNDLRPQGFGFLPAGSGTPMQRTMWTMRCQTRTPSPGTPDHVFCSQLLRDIDSAGTARPTPQARSAALLDPGGAGSAARQARSNMGAASGGSCSPTNPITRQPCITQTGATSNRQYNGDITHKLSFANSCAISASVQAMALPHNDWRGSGIGPNGKLDIVCVQYVRGGTGSCTGFAGVYRVTSSQCR